MDRIKKDESALQEAHLDLMIRLAFDQENLEMVQETLQEDETVLTEKEKISAANAWEKAQSKMDALEKSKKRQHNLECLKTALPRIVKVAACLMLVVAMTFPIAVANSEYFRAKVMQLLIDIDMEKNEAYFSYVENEDATFDVPEGWTGDYFPALIPTGMELIRQSQRICLVEYADAEKKTFSFTELDTDAGASIGTEKTNISYADVHGASACVIDGWSQDGLTHTVNVVWAQNEKWFLLTCNNMDRTEALEIASSVKKIVR